MESDKTSPSRSDSISDSQPRARPLQGRTYGPSRRSTKGQWTPEEDEILREAVQHYQGKNWKKIALRFKDRTDVQCLHRWQKVLNPDLVKGPWTKEEDDAIIELVKIHGPKKWSTIAKHLPGRIGKQCRERWHNHLNPNINKEAWTQEEELALIRAHQVYGNKWAELTKFLPGRSDNAIKNHWNSSVKKKMDYYLASGLLAQFQGLPNSIPIIEPVRASSSKTPPSSEENSPAGDGPEMEDVSQCSQGSAAIGGCSQSTSELGNTSMSTGKEFAEYTVPLEWGTSMVKDWRLDQNNIPDIPDKSSLNMEHDMSGQYLHSLSAPFLDSSNAGGNNGTPSFPPQYSTCLVNMALATENNTMDCSSDSLQYQSLNNLNPVDGGTFTLESFQPFDAPSQPASDNASLLFGIDQIVFDDSSIGHEDHNILPDRNDGFIHSNDACGSPSHRPEEDTMMTEQLDQRLDTSVAPENIHRSPALGDVGSDEQKDTGDLFYEPPRFPSFDIPFFSCDLQQPNSEMQQEYSPLGIRHFMMSSVNCPTPFRLWGSSPSRDDSPEAVLKSAAKTFTGTPSILKKRHRDMLSPLSERRTEKKLESTGSFSSLARDFSRLEVMFNESELLDHDTDHGNEDKENKVPCSIEVEKDEKGSLLNSQTERLEKDTDGSVPYDNANQPGDVETVCTVASRGVTSSETPRSSGRKDGFMNLASFMNSAEKVENHGNSSGAENINIFLGTPFRRSMESPSAWASPWFINSFQPGPRVDTEITVEDMEIFMSTPGDRSYDALGLMKQLSEQTASAFAAAQEVLGNETPKTASKDICNHVQKDNDMEEEEGIGEQYQAEHHHSPPPSGLNIMAPERRTLDFSECGTPDKASENGKSPNAIKFSTCSSYLLKGCR